MALDRSKVLQDPSKVFDDLTGKINELMDTNPPSHDLGERISQLFRDHGVKPNKSGIRKIVKDYVKRTGN